MSRPIDGNDFMRRLTLDTSKGHYGEFMDGSEVAFTSKEIAAFVEQMPTLTPPNEPLTLDELREMDGEPVYIVFLPDADGEKLQFWALVAVDEWGEGLPHEQFGRFFGLRGSLGRH